METVFDYYTVHNRLPHLGDDVPPWSYKGWALPYVANIHDRVLGKAGRWSYYLSCLESENLPQTPIPRIAFGKAGHGVGALLDGWARLVGWDMGGWSDMNRLMEWMAWSLGVIGEAPKLSDKVNEELYRQVDYAPLLKAPRDYFGQWISERKSPGWNPTAFFPTPHQVVECMVEITFHDIKELHQGSRLVTVCDPCVGTGRMLLHASNYSLCLYGQDIDPLVVIACKINGAIYAPWMAFPLPAEKIGRPIPQAPPAPLVGLGEAPVGLRIDDVQQRLLFDEAPKEKRRRR